jgi:gluconate 5-dehydrogenase
MSVAGLFDLTGKVALITGGSRGIGKEVASALAEAGAKIAITARRDKWLDPTAEEFRAKGYDCLAVLGDVTEEESVRAFTAKTIDHFGKIDILFNNAGISWGAPALDMPLDKFRMVLDTNATGTFLCSKAVAPHMIERGRGKIINMASITGLRGTDPKVMQAIGYSASKGAIISMTRVLATHWAPHGITVNAIAPGFVPTRMSEDLIERNEEHMLHDIPLGRLADPRDFWGISIFLASDASDYINGAIIPLDGGISAR